LWLRIRSIQNEENARVRYTSSGHVGSTAELLQKHTSDAPSGDRGDASRSHETDHEVANHVCASSCKQCRIGKRDTWKCVNLKCRIGKRHKACPNSKH
jgi:hypothetical protein